MATTTDQKRTQNPNTTLEENGAAGVIEEDPRVDVKFEDKVDTIEKTDNENDEIVHGEKETVKASMGISRCENKVVLGMDGDNEEGLEDNTCEDNEVEDEQSPSEDDQENFEDNSEEDDEEIVVDMDGVGEEETSEESDDEEDEISEEGGGGGGDEGDEEEGDEEEEEEEGDEEEEEEEEGDEENMQGGKKIGEGDGRAAETEKGGMEAEGQNTKKKEVTPRSTNNSSKRSRDKLVIQGMKKEDSKDKPETSRNKRQKKKVESMGMVFICSSKTKNDCYRYRVFGLPESKKDVVEKIYTGMHLFLYDVDLKLMYGIYKAAGPGGYNIQPKAFKSQFPSQVRFKVLYDCLPLAEEKFKKVIKGNYFTKTKFDCCLNQGQVRKLCELFLSSSKVPRSKKFRSHQVEKRLSVRQGRPRRRRADHNKPRRQRADDDRGIVLREERRNLEPPRKRQRADDDRGIVLREEPRQLEPPRKRRREVFSLETPLRQPLQRTLQRTIPPYAYERPSDVDAYRQDPYLRSRSPYRERRDPYSDEHELYPVRDYRYKDAGDSFTERHDPYRDGPERIVRFREGRDVYPEHRQRYRDAAPIAYTENRDSYISEQNLHLDVAGLYRDSIVSDSYSTHRREPILERDDAYRRTRGLEYVDSYRREELLDRRDPRPSDLIAGRPHDVAPRSSYLPYRERSSYADSIYSAEYLPRTGLTREYRL